MIFERLGDHAAAAAEQRKAARVLELTERLGAEMPAGVEAEASAEGVRLTGRGLRRRFVLEPALRWMRLL
jgi:hypothetical protein